MTLILDPWTFRTEPKSFVEHGPARYQQAVNCDVRPVPRAARPAKLLCESNTRSNLKNYRWGKKWGKNRSYSKNYQT